MKIHIARLHAFTSVCLFFALATMSDAQVPSFNQLGVSPDSAKAARGFSQIVLYNFCSVSQCADGYNPLGGLVRDGVGTSTAPHTPAAPTDLATSLR